MTPLWSPKNLTQKSCVFHLRPGEVGMLVASGMEKYKFRVENEPQTRQTICVWRVLADYDTVQPAGITAGSFCDPVFDMAAVQSDVIYVPTCWKLTCGANTGIIGLPGSYQLELNDATAIGAVQVWLDILPMEKIPPQVASAFFK